MSSTTEKLIVHKPFYQAGEDKYYLDKISDKNGKVIDLDIGLLNPNTINQRNAACEDFFNRHYSISSWGFKGILIPARTDGLKNLAKDLFFPMFIHYALQIDNFVLRIFVSIGAIALDASTLVIRVVVTPFRALYNYYCPATNPVEINEFFNRPPGHFSMATIVAKENGFISLGLETEEHTKESQDKVLVKTTFKTRVVYFKLFSGWVDQSTKEGAPKVHYRVRDSKSSEWIDKV